MWKPGRHEVYSWRAWGIPFAGGASPLPWVKYPGCCSYARCSVAESLLRLVIACSTVISLPLALVAFVPKTRKKKWVRNPDLILGTPKSNWTVRSLLVSPKSGPESEPPHEIGIRTLRWLSVFDLGSFVGHRPMHVQDCVAHGVVLSQSDTFVLVFKPERQALTDNEADET